VDAHAEECFFDKVKTGTKMGLMFEVAEGGFLDIDVRIEGPDGKVRLMISSKSFYMRFRWFIRERERATANTPSRRTWTASTDTASATR